MKEYKILFADLDGTLITTASGKTFAEDCTDFRVRKEVLDKMMEADVIVYATPVYYYSMCGTLKRFFDRCYPIFRHLENKDYYIITAAGSSNGNVLIGIRDFISFSKNPTEKAVFSGFGDVKSQPDLLKEVYDAGFHC